MFPQKVPSVAVYRATISYPRYGTVKPNGYDENGSDFPRLSLNRADYARFETPVSVSWIFEAGRDYPRIRTRMSLAAFGPDQTSFDMRGPYGVLEFDGGADFDVKKVMWGDRFQFQTSSVPLTRNSEWTWNVANKKGRYNALVAGPFEMGLFEPTPFRATATRDGWSDNRGSTSSLRPDGEGCGGAQNLPSDWEWPYQSDPVQPAVQHRGHHVVQEDVLGHDVLLRGGRRDLDGLRFPDDLVALRRLSHVEDPEIRRLPRARPDHAGRPHAHRGAPRDRDLRDRHAVSGRA